jgi:hypothetical protein
MLKATEEEKAHIIGHMAWQAPDHSVWPRKINAWTGRLVDRLLLRRRLNSEPRRG